MKLLISYKKKHNPKKQHLVNSRYGQLTTRQQFYGDVVYRMLFFCSMSFLIFIKLSAGKGFYSLVTLCYFNKLNLHIQ